MSNLNPEEVSKKACAVLLSARTLEQHYVARNYATLAIKYIMDNCHIHKRYPYLMPIKVTERHCIERAKSLALSKMREAKRKAFTRL